MKTVCSLLAFVFALTLVVGCEKKEPDKSGLPEGKVNSTNKGTAPPLPPPPPLPGK